MAAGVRGREVSREALRWGTAIDRVSNVALVACAAWGAWSGYYDDKRGVCLATAAALTVAHGSHLIKVCVLGIPGAYVPDHL